MGESGKLVISEAFNATDSQTCNYNHDDLSRISTANCGAIWGQTFTYDAFGNITKTVIPGSAGNSFQPTYSSSTNRITAISGFTPTYDHNGNVLNDNSHIYAMDADNKAVTIDGIGVTYDAMDRMVEQNRSGAHTQIVYAATGEKFALMSGQTLQKALVPLPGGGTAVYNNNGLLYYGHSDHLGSIRVGSTPTRAISFDLAYAPFGETYAPFGSTDTSFTGQRADTSLGLFDFPVREYSNQGRWSTPDPAGLAAASLAFPQSWNRYAYVMNNPLASVDPLGQECVWDDGSFDSAYDPVTGSVGGCTFAGGTYFDPSTFEGGGGLDWNPNPDPGLAALLPYDPSGPSITQDQNGNPLTAWGTYGGGSLFWTFVNAFWSGVPWAGSIGVQSGSVAHLGASIPFAYIPKTNTLCVGLGPALGVSPPGEAVTLNAGPLLLIDGNAKSILSGPSLSWNIQAFPLVGYQESRNTSGRTGGPTLGTSDGTVAATYSGCADLPH